MNWVNSLALIFHLLLAVAIVGLVLLQRGKGADAGAGFGAGASGTVFGSRGSASFLSRTTAILATLFFLTSLGLSYLLSQDKPQASVMDTLPLEQPAPAPVAPTPQQTAPVVPPAASPPAAGTAEEPASTLPAPAGQ